MTFDEFICNTLKERGYNGDLDPESVGTILMFLDGFSQSGEFTVRHVDGKSEAIYLGITFRGQNLVECVAAILAGPDKCRTIEPGECPPWTKRG